MNVVNDPHLYDKVVPYLTKEAQVAYDQLLLCGIDSDLALVLLEHLAGESSIYELGDEEV